ncbi:hypothetical protein LCGC14_2256230 [marine sediment metagenome]|uniref:Uncharacterized protein n=1 Tax=marine sediment metagenome TaxID=412755 RepID=A0A0F9DNH7_9ZZZZ
MRQFGDLCSYFVVAVSEIIRQFFDTTDAWILALTAGDLLNSPLTNFGSFSYLRPPPLRKL